MINFDLSEFMSPVFIETGTGLTCDGIRKAIKAGFPRIVSIEISPELHRRAQEALSDEIKAGRVSLMLGDSAECLELVLKNLSEKATFWLDAHADGAYSAGLSKKKCPLMDEIEAIGRHQIKGHTIMVDDRRLFRENERRPEAKTSWGLEISEGEVCWKLTCINPKYKLLLKNGYIPDDILVAVMP